LTGPFGEDIHAFRQLLGLLVEEQVVVAEMRTADMPVEVLGLDIEREGIGDERIKRSGYVLHCLRREIGRGIEPRRGSFQLSRRAAQGMPRGEGRGTIGEALQPGRLNCAATSPPRESSIPTIYEGFA